MLAKLIWDTLSTIDVSDFTEKKQNLTYLSWAHAWGVMCKHFPDTTYYFVPEEFADGTVEYTCHITVNHGGQRHTQMMWLPVMDHRNKAIQNPDAFQRNTCKMRCLTKCLSMMGLGWYIYAGEDLPIVEIEKINEQEQKLLHDLIVKTETDLHKFFAAFKIKALADLPKDRFEKALAALEKKLEAKGEGNE
jgi:hypothetical protein